MNKPTWEKEPTQTVTTLSRGNRLKFIVAGLLLVGAAAYLIVSGTLTSQRYFITIEDLLLKDDYAGQAVRITGAVIGDSIEYDSATLSLDFTVAHIPEKTDDLARDLHLAVNNPDALRLPVHLENEVMPDLLQHEAQAILTGSLGEDGVFYASELLLKCPSRYEEAVPDQIAAAAGNEA